MAHAIGRNLSENQYQLAERASEHAGNLEEEDISMGNFVAMCNRAVQLANIPENQLPYHQRQLGVLTQMLDMSSRDRDYTPTFKMLYYNWYNRLILTKAVNGKGMDDLVAMAIGKQSGPQYAFNPDILKQQEEQQKSFFEALLGGGKKPQQQEQPQGQYPQRR